MSNGTFDLNIITIILVLGIVSVSAQAATTVTLSDEVFGNNSAGRTAAATLDDTWAASFPNGIFSPDLFSGGSGHSGSKTFTDATGASYQVDWLAGYIDGAGFGTPTSTTFVTVSSGNMTYSASNVIQGGAPNPFATETRLSTGYSASGMNAIQLDFSNSTTPIYQFGIFAGDVESRPNNGTVGRVIVYDTAGVILRDEPIIYIGTVLNGTNYTVTEPLGSPSGSANNNGGDWGNDTTFFLTIKSDQAIGKVIFHTGDDDHTSLNNATSEQLGLVAFQLPKEPIYADMIDKDVTFSPDHTGEILAGSVVFYTHKLTPASSGTVTFSSSNMGNVSTDWSAVLYQDSNCNGALDGNEGNSPVAANIAMNAGSDICLINKVYAPSNVNAGESYQNVISANVDFGNAIAGTVLLTVTDVTKAAANEVQNNPQGASRLELKKTVENTTQGTAETETQNQAKSGDILKYRIYYSNTGTGSLTDLVINDTIPDFTVLNGSPVCELPLPTSLTSYTPAVTGNAIRWTFPANEVLKGGAQGVVSYEVQIE